MRKEPYAIIMHAATGGMVQLVAYEGFKGWPISASRYCGYFFSLRHQLVLVTVVMGQLGYGMKLVA